MTLRWEIMAMDEELDFFVNECYAEPGAAGRGEEEKLQLIEGGSDRNTFWYRLIFIYQRTLSRLRIIKFWDFFNILRSIIDQKPEEKNLRVAKQVLKKKFLSEILCSCPTPAVAQKLIPGPIEVISSAVKSTKMQVKLLFDFWS